MYIGIVDTTEMHRKGLGTWQMTIGLEQFLSQKTPGLELGLGL